MAIQNIYNIEQAYDILKTTGISKTTLYRAIKSGQLKAVKVGKRYVISEKAINCMLEGIEYDYKNL